MFLLSAIMWLICLCHGGLAIYLGLEGLFFSVDLSFWLSLKLG